LSTSSAISFDFEEMNEFDLNDLRSEGQCHQHILGEICFGGREKVSDPLQTDNLKPQQFAKLLVPFIDRNWPVKVRPPRLPVPIRFFLFLFSYFVCITF
jgi:hypothetical protein